MPEVHMHFLFLTFLRETGIPNLASILPLCFDFKHFNLKGTWYISGRVPGTRCSKSTGAYAPVAPVLTEALYYLGNRYTFWSFSMKQEIWHETSIFFQAKLILMLNKLLVSLLIILVMFLKISVNGFLRILWPMVWTWQVIWRDFSGIWPNIQFVSLLKI